MNYYKAREQDELPKLVFDLVATSEEELEAKGLSDDPLVVTEEQLTDEEHEEFISYLYGICHLRITNGELEARPSGEIEAAEEAFDAATNSQAAKTVGGEIEAETFSYDDKEFPLHASARAVYDAIIAKGTGNYNIYSLEGVYALMSANIRAFAAAYQNKIIAIQTSSAGAVSE